MRFVKPPDVLTFNALLYGPSKVGKSLGAASAEGPIMFLNADMPGSTRLVHARFGDRVHEVPVEDLGTLVEVTNAISADTDPKFATVVLDTAGDTYRRVIEGMSRRAIRPTLNQYGDTGTYIERFCRSMCELPVNFIITAQEVSERNEETGAFERLPFTGTGNPALGAKLMAMVDVVAHLAVSVDADGQAQYVAELLGVGGRRGGDRFDALGQVRAVDLTEWAEAISGSVQSVAEASEQKGERAAVAAQGGQQ